MKALVLAAGYATRLWPLTIDTPKPLLKLGKKSIIDHIIAKLAAAGNVDEVIVVTNSSFYGYFKKWQRLRPGDEKISVIDDGVRDVDKRKGSVGDIAFVVKKRKIRSDLLVVAGDNIFDFSLYDFIARSKANAPYMTVGLFDIGKKALAKRYGIVKAGKDLRIVSFVEKPEKPASTLASMCLYYFPQEKLRMVARYENEGCSMDLAGSFIKWLSGKEPVYGHVFKGKWLDIGDKLSLAQARRIKWDK